jgi:hypothetical protein
VQAPEPEIFYAPGAELTLWLTKRVTAAARQPRVADSLLTRAKNSSWLR